MATPTHTDPVTTPLDLRFFEQESPEPSAPPLTADTASPLDLSKELLSVEHRSLLGAQSFLSPTSELNIDEVRAPDTDSQNPNLTLSDLEPLSSRRNTLENPPTDEPKATADSAIGSFFSAFASPVSTATPVDSVLDRYNEDTAAKICEKLNRALELSLKVKTTKGVFEAKDKKYIQAQYETCRTALLNTQSMEPQTHVRLARLLMLIHYDHKTEHPDLKFFDNIPKAHLPYEKITAELVSQCFSNLKKHTLSEEDLSALNLNEHNTHELNITSTASDFGLVDWMTPLSHALLAQSKEAPAPLAHPASPLPVAPSKAVEPIHEETPSHRSIAPKDAPAPERTTSDTPPEMGALPDDLDLLDGGLGFLSEQSTPESESNDASPSTKQSFKDLFANRDRFNRSCDLRKKAIEKKHEELCTQVLSLDDAALLAEKIRGEVAIIVSHPKIRPDIRSEYRTKYDEKIQQINSMIQEISDKEKAVLTSLDHLTSLNQTAASKAEIEEINFKLSAERIDLLKAVKRLPQAIATLRKMMKDAENLPLPQKEDGDTKHGDSKPLERLPLPELFSVAQSYLPLMTDLDRAWMSLDFSKNFSDFSINPEAENYLIEPEAPVKKRAFKQRTDFLGPELFLNRNPYNAYNVMEHPFSFPMKLLGHFLIDLLVISKNASNTQEDKGKAAQHGASKDFLLYLQSLLDLHLESSPRFDVSTLELLKTISMNFNASTQKEDIKELVKIFDVFPYLKEIHQDAVADAAASDIQAFWVMIQSSLSQSIRKAKSLDCARIKTATGQSSSTSSSELLVRLALFYHQKLEDIQSKNYEALIKHISEHYAPISSLLSTPFLKNIGIFSIERMEHLLKVAAELSGGDKYPNSSNPACHYLGRTLIKLFLDQKTPSAEDIKSCQTDAFALYMAVSEIQSVASTADLNRLVSYDATRSVYHIDPITSIHVLLDRNSTQKYAKNEQNLESLTQIFRTNVSRLFGDMPSACTLITQKGCDLIQKFGADSDEDSELVLAANQLIYFMELLRNAPQMTPENFDDFFQKICKHFEGSDEASKIAMTLQRIRTEACPNEPDASHVPTPSF